MSEELDNKVNEIDNEQEPKKRTSRKKENSIVEKYQYKNDEMLELIVDKPNQPLIKSDMVDSVIDSNKPLKENVKMKLELKSNKELYESYIKDLKFFSLLLNDDIIYDSSIDNSKNNPLKFENDFFILYGKRYSYNGLKIKKINK